jgi:hypothetical protein
MTEIPSRRTPSLSGVLAGVADATMARLNVCKVARVESYDDSTMKCAAQPLGLCGVPDEDGHRATMRLPVIRDVPVVFPGSGGRRIKFPVSVGDYVLLVFSDDSLEQWLARGGEVDPLDDRHHHLADAIAIPGIMPFAGSGSAGNASPMLEITSSEVLAGGNQSLALQSLLSDLISAFNLHVHTGVTTGPGTSGPPGPGDLVINTGGTSITKGA